MSQITSVVLVWFHIIRFSFSQKANEEQSLVLALVSQLKKVTKTRLVLVNHIIIRGLILAKKV